MSLLEEIEATIEERKNDLKIWEAVEEKIREQGKSTK